jgi:hypothetical protein
MHVFIYRVSEWLLFNVKWAFCQPYHDENKLHFNDMMMMLICTRPTRLIGNSASWLKQPSVGRHVAPLGHIILIPSQPVFSLASCNSVISREATNSNSIVYGLIWPRLEPTIYRTRGEMYSIQHYVIKFVSGFLRILRFTPPIKPTATI